MKKAQAGASMPKKPVSKPAIKKSTDPAPKKRTYPIIPDEVTNEGYLKLGPREKTPGGGFSRNGSKVKKAKNGFDLNKDGKTTFKDVLIGRGVLPKTAKMGGAMAKQAAVAIAMKKAGKTPKKKMQYGGEAASMVPPAMMKKGGAMKKCKYGCK